MKRRRTATAALFLVVMLTLAGTVILQWRTHSRSPGSHLEPDPTYRVATQRETRDAEGVINEQLRAFQHDNFEHAIALQSTWLHRSFATPDRFRSTIHATFPQFCTFKSVRYGQCYADQSGHRVSVTITLLSPQGVETDALYNMMLEGKTYRVFSVDTQPVMHRRNFGSSPR